MNQTQLSKMETTINPSPSERRPGKWLGLPRTMLCWLTIIASCNSPLGAAEVPAIQTPPVKSEETNSQELRTYLQLQEQLHATQLAIEQTRKEAVQLSAQNNEALAARLQAIEQSLSAQRASELKAMESSNRVMLIMAGAFAAMGFVAMLLMGYFQWKTINRLAEISTALPGTGFHLGAPHPLAAIGPGSSAHLMPSPIEQGTPALLESVQRLEKRLHELEIASPQKLSPAEEPSGEAKNGGTPNGTADANAASEAATVTLMLNKGQALLNIDKTEEALQCFESVLALDPRNPEALVKKGTALEKLRKLNEAIACYDQAIAADETMTIAYLYKGGVFNRMEKFSEALECYEQALRTQEKRRA